MLSLYTQHLINFECCTLIVFAFADAYDYSSFEDDHVSYADFGQRVGRRRQFTKSSVKSSKSFRCTSEGFHPDPVDCMAFYRCVPNGDGFTMYSVILKIIII